MQYQALPFRFLPFTSLRLDQFYLYFTLFANPPH
jgi:hypothetical protein